MDKVNCENDWGLSACEKSLSEEEANPIISIDKEELISLMRNDDSREWVVDEWYIGYKYKYNTTEYRCSFRDDEEIREFIRTLPYGTKLDKYTISLEDIDKNKDWQ